MKTKQHESPSSNVTQNSIREAGSRNELRDILKKNEKLSYLDAFAKKYYSKGIAESIKSDEGQRMETRMAENFALCSSFTGTAVLLAVGAMKEKEL